MRDRGRRRRRRRHAPAPPSRPLQCPQLPDQGCATGQAHPRATAQQSPRPLLQTVAQGPRGSRDGAPHLLGETASGGEHASPLRCGRLSRPDAGGGLPARREASAEGWRRQKDESWPPEVCCTVYTSGKLAKAARRPGRGAADKAGPSRAGRKRRYGGI